MPDYRSRDKRSARGRSRHVSTAEEIEQRNSELTRSHTSHRQKDDSSEPEDDFNSKLEDSEEEDTPASENPNHNPELASNYVSRREREAIEKMRNERIRDKLTAQGKTHQAKADLKRLEEVRARREEMARKRAAENN